MVTLLMPNQILARLAGSVRERRLTMGLTQAGLSARSGVALGTLRKFERTGLASTDALIKLLIVVGDVDALLAALKPQTPSFNSIDEVLNAGPAPRRKNGWRS